MHSRPRMGSSMLIDRFVDEIANIFFDTSLPLPQFLMKFVKNQKRSQNYHLDCYFEELKLHVGSLCILAIF